MSSTAALKRAVALIALAAAVAVGAGVVWTATRPDREYGGPLAQEGWRVDDAGCCTVELPVVTRGGRAYGGMSVVTNRAGEPATIERITLLRSPGLELDGAYVADPDRTGGPIAGGRWPPGEHDFPRGSIRPARGAVLPPEQALELLPVVRFPSRNRYVLPGIRLDYRVGDDEYRVDIPHSYMFRPRGVRGG